MIDFVGRIAQAGIVAPVCQRVFDDLLNFSVEAEVDAVTARAEFVFHRIAVRGSIFQTVEVEKGIHHVADGVFDVVRIGVHIRRSGGFFQHAGRRTIQRGIVLLGGNQPVFTHLPQHIIRAVVGDVGRVAAFGVAGIEVAARVVIIRASGQTGQHRAFAKRQLIQFLAEIAVSRHAHAVVTAAEEDGVQIAFQNLFFCVARFQLHRQIGFLQLALVGLLAGKHGLLDELLGDG